MTTLHKSNQRNNIKISTYFLEFPPIQPGVEPEGERTVGRVFKSRAFQNPTLFLHPRGTIVLNSYMPDGTNSAQ